jgi:hypothetical protein
LVEVRGRITKPVVADPRQLTFGLVPVNERVRKIVRLTSPHGKGLRFVRYEAQPSVGTIDTNDIKEHGAGLDVPVDVLLSQGAGTVTGLIRLVVLVEGYEETAEIEFFVAPK